MTTRYVLVYLTSLPKEGRGYRGGIYEAEVRSERACELTIQRSSAANVADERQRGGQ